MSCYLACEVDDSNILYVAEIMTGVTPLRELVAIYTKWSFKEIPTKSAPTISIYRNQN